MLELIVIVPIIIAGIIAIILNNRFGRSAAYVSIAGSLASLVIALYLFTNSLTTIQKINWFSVAGYSINITTTTAHLNMLLLLLVSIIAPLIMWYSLGYMDKQEEQSRFYFEMNLFTASMVLFAISANFISLFIAWEGLGITSYLLIGFWYKKRLAPLAARKSITTIIIGDIAMLSAIVILWNTYGTFSFDSILAAPATNGLYAAALLIIIAVFTKSAQFPFTEWLADAMEGPTPVSAFLHSSTMVKAGVFLAIVLMPIFLKVHLLYIFLIIGAFSAVLGVLNALSENHIKRILAYSTIEDLGLMFVAVGLNAFGAAILLFVVQTFYKALLFMSAGSIIKANNGKENIFKIFGSTNNKLLFVVVIIGVLSLAGIFPLSGFFGKIGIDVSANSIPIYVILALIEFGSSIYIFRWLFIPMRKTTNKSLIVRFGKLPKSMLLPPVILAGLVFVGDLIYFYMPNYLGIRQFSIGLIDPIIESLIVFIGLIIAYIVYRRKHMLGIHNNLKRLMYNSAPINAAYYTIALAFTETGKLFCYFDSLLFRLFDEIGRGTFILGNEIRNIVNGDTNVYVAGMTIGIILLVLFVVFG